MEIDAKILCVIVVTIMAIIALTIHGVVGFCSSTKEEQRNSLKEWLLYAVTLAEKELGSGTGKLKLRYVYDMFVVKFPWLAKIVTFTQFSIWVDQALEEMNHLLTNNAAVKTYVSGSEQVVDKEETA